MELKDIATVSGKGGLFKILKPTRTGVILESLDDHKTKMVANAHNRVSILEEISIYTTTQEGSVALKEVLQKISNEFDDDPGIDSNASSEELRAFLKHILPDYDPARVYPSDIKKIVLWYKVLLKYAPEAYKEEKSEDKEGND